MNRAGTDCPEAVNSEELTTLRAVLQRWGGRRVWVVRERRSLAVETEGVAGVGGVRGARWSQRLVTAGPTEALRRAGGGLSA